MNQSTARTAAAKKSTGDPHFDEYASLMDEAGIQYWAEAGTLLALVREGRLFEHDKDMDIGVWSDDLDKLGAVLEDARAGGRRVARETYRGRPFKFKIFPKKGEGGRVLDIQVYRRAEHHAWSAVHTVGNYDYRWYRMDLVARGAIRWPLRMYLAHRATDVEVTSFPWNRMGWLGTWLIPLELLERTDRQNPFALPYPDPVEDYLGYRYGDWKNPRSGWVYWQDDGAYHPGPPEKHQP